MSTSIQPPLATRRNRAALLIGLGLLVISALFIQQVIAQSNQPVSLKPPFHLIRSDNLSPASGVPPLPINAPIIMTQTFDSSYLPSHTISGSGWHEVSFSGIVDTYTWGRVAGVPITDSVWCAGTNPPGTNPLTPGTPYTNNQQSLLVYGPVDLSDIGAAVLTATYHSDVQTGDFFGAAVSTDGTNFVAISSESSRDPSLSIARTGYYNLNAYARQPSVWIAFYFTSDNDNVVALGTYIDEVVLRGQPLLKTYVPLIRRDLPPTPTPTPTPTATPQATYLYNYTFGNGGNTNSQFIEWGSKVTDVGCFLNPNDCVWGQDIVTSGNPDGAMTMYQTGLNSIAGASPNVSAPANFEYSADIYVIQGKTDARYGLIFGASLGAFGRDGDGVPYFDPNRNMYKFDLQFNESDNTVVSYYRLQRCQTDINGCTNIVEKTSVPAGVVRGAGNWNTITVQRMGSTGNIKVYVNGYLLIGLDDQVDTGNKKFGIFIQSKSFNNDTNPLKIRFDNAKFRTLP